VSILAEIIQHHRSEKGIRAHPEARPDAEVQTGARDPICGMRVDIATAQYHSEAWGRTVYFCCRRCQETFDRDPERHRAAIGA